jgi:hypothetical protein
LFAQLSPEDINSFYTKMQSDIQTKEDLDSTIDLNLVAEAFKSVEPNMKPLLMKSFVAKTQQLAPGLKVKTTTAYRDRTYGIIAGLLAGPVAKKGAELAFAEEGRSMTSPTILKKLGTAFVLMTEEKQNENEKIEKNDS